VQDLGAFLHDLFRALRYVEHHPQEQATAPASTAASSSTTSASTASAAGSASSTPVQSYHHYGFAHALQTLISDLSDTASSSTTSSSSTSGTASSTSASGATGATASGGLSSVISQLNGAFEKLIADLGGQSGAAGNTSALKNFLNQFLQDLQGGSSTGSTGNLVNTRA
jgi:hypothetical protein